MTDEEKKDRFKEIEKLIKSEEYTDEEFLKDWNNGLFADGGIKLMYEMTAGYWLKSWLKRSLPDYFFYLDDMTISTINDKCVDFLSKQLILCPELVKEKYYTYDLSHKEFRLDNEGIVFVSRVFARMQLYMNKDSSIAKTPFVHDINVESLEKGITDAKIQELLTDDSCKTDIDGMVYLEFNEFAHLWAENSYSYDYEDIIKYVPVLMAIHEPELNYDDLFNQEICFGIRAQYSGIELPEQFIEHMHKFYNGEIKFEDIPLHCFEEGSVDVILYIVEEKLMNEYMDRTAEFDSEDELDKAEEKRLLLELKRTIDMMRGKVALKKQEYELEKQYKEEQAREREATLEKLKSDKQKAEQSIEDINNEIERLLKLKEENQKRIDRLTEIIDTVGGDGGVGV